MGRGSGTGRTGDVRGGGWEQGDGTWEVTGATGEVRDWSVICLRSRLSSEGGGRCELLCLECAAGEAKFHLT